MGSVIANVGVLAALVPTVFGFCGSHTHLSTRAEEGEVKINTFGYVGEIVSSLPVDGL